MKTEDKKYTLSSLDGSISTRMVLPDKPIAILVLAHGAGAGIDHQFMQGIQQYLGKEDIASYAFNFLYRELGKRTPFRMTEPQQVYREIWNHIRDSLDFPMFAAGKSYGGRVGSTITTDLTDCRGLVFLGYPFHPANHIEKLRTEHLYDITLPMLFLQGSRDALSTPDIANGFVEEKNTAELVWFEDGDHSWKTRKRSGYSQEDHMQSAASKIREFCQIHTTK